MLFFCCIIGDKITVTLCCFVHVSRPGRFHLIFIDTFLLLWYMSPGLITVKIKKSIFMIPIWCLCLTRSVLIETGEVQKLTQHHSSLLICLSSVCSSVDSVDISCHSCILGDVEIFIFAPIFTELIVLLLLIR